jgi:hypothetical protein
MEYGFSAVASMGILCFFAYSMQSVRDLRFQVRQGAMTWIRGVDGHGRELETHLVVALARGTVGDGVGALCLRGVHHGLRDDRTGNARSEEILALINRIGPEHGVTEVLRELVTEIRDDAFGRARGLGLGVESLQLFALTHVRAPGDDLAVVLLLEPGENDGGIETTAVREDDLLGFLGSAHRGGSIERGARISRL